MSYITCKDLAVGYDGRAVASGLNFSIDKGDYLCICLLYTSRCV